MTFQDEDIALAWEDILSDNENHLKLVNIQSEYPEKKSLFIAFNDIERHNEEFAFYLLENPDKSLQIGKRVMKGLLPATWDPEHDINLRITDLPKDAKVDISNLRAKHLGKLIAVEGMVRKATPPRPRLSRGLYRCEKCFLRK